VLVAVTAACRHQARPPRAQLYEKTTAPSTAVRPDPAGAVLAFVREAQSQEELEGCVRIETRKRLLQDVHTDGEELVRYALAEGMLDTRE
jgi:hypothetical protein